MPTIDEKRRVFRKLHESGCFVIPNPWDMGTAHYLQSLGFQALATTSAGFNFSRGLPDHGVAREAVLEHCRELVAATVVPINVDFENGYAHAPEGVAESVRLCVETGVAGLSIEDATVEADKPLYEVDYAVARMRAARASIDRTGADVLLVGRAEGFLHGRPLDEAIARLKAYAQAGADCLYAPGIRTREQIAAVVEAVAPKPVNVVVGFASELSIADLAALGVRRISVGCGLARTAWGAFMRAAKQIAENGRFDGFADAAPSADMNRMFRGAMQPGKLQ
jgi:2-methylisocitrate lyase-like PEP mutase family enzyme